TGVVPLMRTEVKLRLNFKLLQWSIPLRVARVLGDRPLLPDDPDGYSSLLPFLIENLKDIDAIYIQWLDVGSFCWRHIRESPVIQDRFLLHVCEASDQFLAELPHTFEAYLTRFNSKHRNNIKRRVRLLREHAGGALELRRVAKREDVPGFLRLAGEVARRSW